MRLWSLHPRHLDRQGLVAVWREALLAQAVLLERTVGYRHHPQLERFRALPRPAAALGCYLSHVAAEAEARGYRFDRDRIVSVDPIVGLSVTDTQIEFEWAHLNRKLRERDLERWRAQNQLQPEPHPMFHVEPGPLERWERP